MDPESPRPGLAELFAGFFAAGLSGFGGVLPFARRIMVERRGWLTGAEFADLFSLCQFLPGPNVVNLAAAFGARQRGPKGAVVAIAGLLAAPVVIVIALGAVYERIGGIPPRPSRPARPRRRRRRPVRRRRAANRLARAAPPRPCRHRR
ncbi:chromate transporter, partial [Acidiphilium sp. PM]|uniref:chromate transporter n=1 Tax=Acidiphilium sp. PM TaxID=1043206 RepID=UPI0002145888